MHIKPFFTRYEQLPSVQECKEEDDRSKRVIQDSFPVDELSEGSLSGDDSSDCQCAECSGGPLDTSVGHMPSVQESKEQDDLPKRVVQDSPRVDESSEDSLSDDDSPDCQCSGGLSDPLVMHMPMARSRFEGMNAQLIVTTSIIDCELMGYREWQSSGGGRFF